MEYRYFFLDHFGGIWRCPKMGVPPNHLFYWDCPLYKPSILGVPPLLETSIYLLIPYSSKHFLSLSLELFNSGSVYTFSEGIWSARDSLLLSVPRSCWLTSWQQFSGTARVLDGHAQGQVLTSRPKSVRFKSWQKHSNPRFLENRKEWGQGGKGPRISMARFFFRKVPID